MNNKIHTTIAMALATVALNAINESEAFTEADNIIEASFAVCPDCYLESVNLDDDGKIVRMDRHIDLDRLIPKKPMYYGAGGAC